MGPTRVTARWLMQRDVARVSAVKSGIAALQEQAYSGRRVQRASDAPAEWVGVEKLRSGQRDQVVYASNAERALNILDDADRTLGLASEVMKRVRELAVGAASEVSTEEYHRAARSEITALREQLLGYANGQHAGRSLFAGTAYDGPAFDASGAYLGSADEPTVRISDSDDATQGFDGSRVFGGAVDVFGLMNALDAALGARDADAVHGLLGGVDTALGQIIDARSRVGVQQRRAEDLGGVAEQLQATLGELVSARVDADPIAVYTQIASLQSTFEATLQISATSMKKSLFHYL